MSKTWAEVVGWYGVVAILGAYALLMFGVLSTQHAAYLWLNVTGSIAIAVDAYAQKNWQPVILNLVWLAIAVVALFRL